MENYHSRPKRFFVRTVCFGKVTRSQTKAFLEKGFPLVSAGDGAAAVVRTFRTDHCFVTCNAVLTFFAVPKTAAQFFLKLEFIGKFLHFLCLCCVRTVS